MGHGFTNISNYVRVWFKARVAQYGPYLFALCILVAGLLFVLLVQPAPPSFAEGWSASRSVDEVKAQYPQQMVIDRDDQIHLAWIKPVDRRSVAFYARLDRYGQLLDGPVQLSTSDVNVEDIQIALTEDGHPLCFWLEKGRADGIQALIKAHPGDGRALEALVTSLEMMRDLTLAVQKETGHIFLVWSGSGGRLYELYLTALNADGTPLLSAYRLTDNGSVFVFEPAIFVAGDVLHMAYFAESPTEQNLVYQAFGVDGVPLVEPSILSRVQQGGSSPLGKSSNAESYPIAMMAGDEGQVYLYESLGETVQYRLIDRLGQVVQPPVPLLTGQRYGWLDLVADGEKLLVWTGLPYGDDTRAQIYAMALDSSGRLAGAPERVTFLSSSAFLPSAVIDSQGGRHVVWQQSAGPYRFELAYTNDLDPAPVSIWQRLGFGGGGWSLSLALAEGVLLAVFTAFLNLWRGAVAGLLAAGAIQIGRRWAAFSRYADATARGLLILTFALLMRPAAQTLGQGPVEIVPAAHWLMILAASALVLYLSRIWKEAFLSLWTWGGMAGLWLWAYYFLNTVLILRQGFAI
ncbi:MAG: hypothetical protein JW934_21140 [Anaerolineae bacterium]|nr:hypothetical protein [Anaerolineae bacterium]